ncbi:MAG: Asp-tRNA(Asn)/Glu-tRNA(Gln) amidotransferase subunit GatA [Candidatus Jorgensenbacteria bacterium]|nr:Asp-tRNA(Asn)/Glu-tRNA(Gln) amidotransferase subunit GatA [Candidatus Jorgensenbacteria bacterium]
MEPSTLTIRSFAEGLRAGTFSAVEGVKKYLENIKTRDAELHAYLETYGEEALAEAARVDEELRSGKTLPAGRQALLGVPVALKDNMLVEGHRATAGSKILERYTASYDATVVAKLKEAGAIVIGKTNLDEFAMGSSTENSAFGPTKNPHDVSRVPGGSSGGSAAAVASDMALVALGSDTGGSIRQPAAFCGVVGMKPTYGAVSRHGLIAMASSLDQIGPLTKTVEDAEIVFNVIRGKDLFDATSAEGEEQKDGEKSFTVGIPKEYFEGELDAEVAKAMDTVIARFRELGYAVKEVSLPHTKYALSVYYLVMPAEVSANLARFDGIRYARIPEASDVPMAEPSRIRDGVGTKTLRDIYELQRGRGFGTEVRRRVLLGTFVLSAGYYDAYYAKAQKVRTLITRDFENAFKEIDVLLTPTTPTSAFKFGEKTKDPVQMYLSDVFTIPADLAGIPAISIPVEKYEVGSGPPAGGLPIGFQLMAPHFHEVDLFALGKKYDEAFRK